MNKISKKYLKMSEVYCIFSSPWKNSLDFSENALVNMYNYETFGKKMEHPNTNGFYVGKQWMDVMIVMWREDINKSLLKKHELYEDGCFPRWWLDKVLV